MALGPARVALPIRLAILAGLVAGAFWLGAGAAAFRGSDRKQTVGSDRRVPPSTPLRAGQFGGFSQGEQDVALITSFDTNKNGRLDATERRAAREYAESAGLARSRWGRRGLAYDAEPGAKVSPEDVRPYPTTPFYDTNTIRTLFLTFENDEWEQELMAFKTTDVDVPATLMVDGRAYRDVGVQFHGNSSFNGVPIGFKHSMRVALDFVHDGQDVSSYNTLLLLNAHEDPSFLRTMLFMQIAREYYPAPQTNLVRVVINGESWGLFVNQQQFNKDMTRELFQTTDGARWKVNGTRSLTGGGLMYLGENESAYRWAYELKSSDGPEPWRALARLTRILEETPPSALEAAAAPHLDIDGTLRFLAVENALVNTDGYWTKASDYNLFMAPSGRFHVLPYDVNGTFASGVGPAGSRTGSIWLNPLQAMGDPTKPLVAKLLAVPSLRARYLGYVREIGQKWLDWNHLGRIVEQHQTRINADVRADTRKLESYEAFRESAAELRSFAERRREFLMTATAGAAGAN